MLSVYLWVHLLIPSALTFVYQETNHSLKLSSQPRCSIQTKVPFDISGAKKVMKNFWFINFLDPFRSYHISLCITWIYCFWICYFAINVLNALTNLCVVWSAVILNELLLLNCMWKVLCILFSLSCILVAIHVWTGKICPNSLNRSCSCTSAWRKNTLLLCNECYGTEHSASKTFSNNSLWYLSQFRKPVIFPNSSHCQYIFPMHFFLESFTGDFLRL